MNQYRFDSRLARMKTKATSCGTHPQHIVHSRLNRNSIVCFVFVEFAFTNSLFDLFIDSIRSLVRQPKPLLDARRTSYGVTKLVNGKETNTQITFDSIRVINDANPKRECNVLDDCDDHQWNQRSLFSAISALKNISSPGAIVMRIVDEKCEKKI